MKIPFTAAQFLEVFQQYNHGVFPLQVLLYLLAIAVIALAAWLKKHSNRTIAAILAIFWFWMGIAYHWAYFSTINKAAYLFGAAFIAQGILFLVKGVFRNDLTFSHKSTNAVRGGSAMILYALAVYPILSYLLGHNYPESPTFGLPSPTTIFTLGILLWLDKKPPIYLIVIPLTWSIIGSVATIKMGIREDIGLIVSGALTIWLLSRNRPI